MPKKAINFAIIGCGRIAPRHGAVLQEIQASHNVHLTAACDVIKGRVQNFTKTYGGDAFLDYHAMLKRDDIDVVSVCTPSGLHAQIGQDCARAGKHVLVEKPMALTLEDADALIGACDQAGVKLSVVLCKIAIIRLCWIYVISSMRVNWVDPFWQTSQCVGIGLRNTMRTVGMVPGQSMAVH